MNDNEDHLQVSADKDSSQEKMVDSISPFVASVNNEDGSNEVGQVYHYHSGSCIRSKEGLEDFK